MTDLDFDRPRVRRDWIDPARSPSRKAERGDDTDDRSRKPVQRASAREPSHPSPERDQDDPGQAKNRDERKGDDGAKAEEADEQKPGEGESEQPAKPVPRWPFVVAGMVVLAFAAVVLWQFFRPRADVWTDDAYVHVHYTTVAPRVSGQVIAVPVDDNQIVKAGDVLALLDPSDYRTALADAEAMLQRDTAQSGDDKASIERQPSVIDQASSDVESARARLAFAQADARRYQNLASTGAGTAQQRQQADTALRQSQAALDGAMASVEANKKQTEVLTQRRLATEGAMKADQARIDQATLNLGYTRVLAKVDGMIGQRSVQVGDYVSPGKTLMALVPLQEVYVNANYREVDLLHVRAGQRATVHVDAYDIDLDGVVNGVPAASGAAFAPIAPNNATGNFTKIVQRLPVRIDIASNQPLAKLLRVGLSVETTIHTDMQDVVAEQRRDPHAVTGR